MCAITTRDKLDEKDSCSNRELCSDFVSVSGSVSKSVHCHKPILCVSYHCRPGMGIFRFWPGFGQCSIGCSVDSQILHK